MFEQYLERIRTGSTQSETGANLLADVYPNRSLCAIETERLLEEQEKRSQANRLLIAQSFGEPTKDDPMADLFLENLTISDEHGPAPVRLPNLPAIEEAFKEH